MDNQPIIYVLAGPNGIGKTTVNAFFIPAGVVFINADDIARQFREKLGNVQTQELANAEALERMNQFIAKKVSFAIETNLADNDTWQFQLRLPMIGYAVHLHFLGTSDVNICIDRVKMRYLHGGHFIRPDIVKLRYENGLKLLQFYKDVPDRLFLTDNSTTANQLCAELQKGEIVFQAPSLPSWVEFVLNDPKQTKSSADDVTDIASIREKYRRMSSKKEDTDTPQ